MSARWEGKVLLEPITADQPCGQNLEDTHRMASFDTFRLFGRATPHDPAPEWAEIRDAALEALRESKDLRLLAHLGTALLRTDGLPGFAETLDVAAEWLTTYWNEVYPLVDEDAMLRRNALNCFADQMAVVEGLRRMPLVNSRQHGRFSLREIEIAAGQGRPAENEAAPDESQIAAAFVTMPVDGLTQLQESATRALSAIQRIDGTMRSRADGMVPAFDPLVAVMTKIDRVLRVHLAARTNGNGHPSDAGGPVIPVAADRDASPSTPVGVIRSRQDALHALDAVADFFRQTEPASPVPLFLERAKRLVGKSFLEVLADVAPEALAQARAAGGVREE